MLDAVGRARRALGGEHLHQLGRHYAHLGDRAACALPAELGRHARIASAAISTLVKCRVRDVSQLLATGG